MVDNRATGLPTGGGLSFRSPESTASKMNSQKYSSNEYIDIRSGQEQEESFQQKPFVDQSAQLRAALASLAMINMPKVIKKASVDDILEDEDDFDKEEKEYTEEDDEKENAD